MDDNKKLVSVQPEMLRYVDSADLESWDYDALVEAGRSVIEVKTYASWLVGRLGDAVSKKRGDLMNYAKDINQDYGALQQYVNAYRKFTREDPNFSPDKYFGQVPWGLMQLVATSSDTPIKLLDELVDKGAKTIQSAYREIKKKAGKEMPRKPHIAFHWDDEGGKWKLMIKPEDFSLIDFTDIREQLISYLNSLV